MKIASFILPLISLSLVAFVAHLLWEASHVSLYTGYEGLSPTFPIHVWAAIGDVLYTLGIYFVVALFKKDVLWLRRVTVLDLVTLALVGFVLAVGIEWKALFFERWAYLPSMPIIPLLEVGLSPILQMVILLPFSVYVAGRFFKVSCKEGLDGVS